MAIILDTNILPQLGVLRHVIMSAALKVASHHQMDVCLPDLVVEESVAGRRRGIADAAAKLSAAADTASKYFDVEPIYLPDPTEAAEEWRAELESTFRILSLHPDDAKRALEREANREPPAREGRGARDSAIWLTALREHLARDEQTYFISNNTKDFSGGKGGSDLHPALLQELGAKAATFRYLTTLAEFVSLMATEFKYALPTETSMELLQGLFFQVVSRFPEVWGDLAPAGLSAGESIAPFSEAGESVSVESPTTKCLKAYAVGDSRYALVECAWTVKVDDGDGNTRVSKVVARAWAQVSATDGSIVEVVVDSLV